MPRRIDESLHVFSPGAERPEPERERARLAVADREGERRRMAAELHDQIGANLSAIKLMLQSATNSLHRESVVDGQLLLECQQALEDTIRGVRDLCAEWRPSTLDYRGLVAALEYCASQFERRTGVAIELELSAYDEPRPPEVELMLLRVVQEALRNCAAHACARRVRVVFRRRDDDMTLSIEDDGKGFDERALGSSVDGESPGIGLLNMRERALAAGASFSLESAQGCGTRVIVHF